MYESMTYEVILKRMMDRVPNGLDKREGSLIYTALSAAAAEMQIVYIEFDTILKETFAQTASRENLIRRAAERGLQPTEATRAVLKAVAVPDTVLIKKGERFRQGTYYYTVSESMGNGTFQVVCEKAGEEGNHQFGRLIPVQNISGLTSMEITELLIPGEESVDTEVFRKNYFDSFEKKSYGGNKQDYIEKTNGIAGVGATKVTRAWDGPSTVKLTILDSDCNKASDLLVQTVQNIMDPAETANGDGLAPIDHRVTVVSAEAVPIQISTALEINENYTLEALKELINKAVEDYLKEIRTSWESMGDYGCIVRISQLESKILSIEGIYDIKNTKINGQTVNLELNPYQIPVNGGVAIDS
ncbi:baseplate J/gp47 family protein [Lacrimispora sp.]|uniref:baseplate J/gp47 family protein n=1 Tax=Lacrimispora sp. TaxID=2719234 RepID=UPI0029E1EB26|nr:hypothetical protein [Lacrimispora sp.]